MVTLATDTLVIDHNNILLIRREPDCVAFPDCWALPGGRFEVDDASLAICAIRETKEETGLDVAVSFFNYFDAKDRDPRERSVSIVFLGKMIGGKLKAGDDAVDAAWFDISDVLDMKLAFDHTQIVSRALLSGFFNEGEWDDMWDHENYVSFTYPDGSTKQQWWWDWDGEYL